jgi:Flp pilus assembly protein TadD
MPAQKISTVGFLSEFERRRTLLPDRPFCWVLGAGASVQSGIPTGGTLVLKWLRELYEMEDLEGRSFKDWATPTNLHIKDFKLENAATFYPWVYWRRYRKLREQGYAFLEKLMESAEPSYGYSVLAQIMASTPHTASVTTNFDNLIADALAIYTRARPLVCGHESLTGFLQPNLKRPFVAKVHRDLLLHPMNEPDQLATLPNEWQLTLKMIFEHYTPIVIGYGGNDGSLMGLLSSLRPVRGGMFWCYHTANEPDARIHDVVARHDGNLVPILGFDELMLQLGKKLKLIDPRPALQKTHDKRVAEWQRQFEDLNKKVKGLEFDKAPAEELRAVRKAAATVVNWLIENKTWWAWQLKADAEPDPAKRETIFREGLRHFPKSAGLTGNLALLIHYERKNYKEAEQLYRKALELDENDANIAGNFAIFLTYIRKDYDEAERLYRKALALDPKHANHMGNYARFMSVVRKNNDEAERLYRKAIALDSNNIINIAGLAYVRGFFRKDYDEAELLYRKAIELNPTDAVTLGSLAYLRHLRKDYDEAERLYRKALELDPNNAPNIGNFAEFMNRVRKDYDAAERHYRRAVDLDPKNNHWKKQLAKFLTKHPEFDK